ncbi:ATP-binding protein [Streptomyces sp. NPDC091272]|uniref:ATP-binding protein n=1 Tax=Streptomyces sp. NPDC091272 TaxID=3365981 RepID=UPI00382A7B15
MNDEIGKGEVPPHEREFTQQLSATPRGARLARRLAVQQLDMWGVPFGCEVSDAVALVVAELAANAVTHGRVSGRDFRLGLRLNPYTVRVGVTDPRGERRPPVPGMAPPPPGTATTGYGLVLVQELAKEWGVSEPEAGTVGKTVWAEVPLMPPPAPRTPPTGPSPAAPPGRFR